MKRRTFVRSAAISAFGLSLNPFKNSIFNFQATRAHQWLGALVSATLAKRRSGPSVGSGSFQELSGTLNAYFAKRGYKADHSGYYFYNGGYCCFYPLKLEHSASGLSDVLVPVLAHSTDGSWRHINTFTGYQMEALARAADALADYPVPLQQLLLPATGGRVNHALGAYRSQHADVTMATRIKDGKAETDISISDAGRVFFKDTFVSKHCLTSDTAKV